jgi:adenine deaminase
MKVTIQITTSNLKKLTEDGGYNELVFNVEESYESSGRLRGMRVARDTRYFTTSKQARKVDAQREKQQKRLEAAKVSDFLIEVKRTNQAKYKVLKIEPEQIFLASNRLKECAWILRLV